MLTEQVEIQPIPEDWDRGLAIAAHPDDLEYGAASAIARWTSQGKWIGYVLATKGEAGIDGMRPEEVKPLRAREEIESARVVGVETVEFLDYVDGVIEYGLPLRRDIAKAIRRHRPEVIVTVNHRLTWGTDTLNMADHRAVGLAVLDAARDAGNRWIFTDLLEEGLDPWNGVRFVCLSGSPDAGHAVDVTESIEKGVESLRQHEGYIKGLGQDFNPDAFLKDAASWAGAAMGVRYAVKLEMMNV